jgi:hypothetical protein
MFEELAAILAALPPGTVQAVGGLLGLLKDHDEETQRRAIDAAMAVVEEEAARRLYPPEPPG